jgi:HAD superfamily hydrolase (TIGR01549 family)
LASCFAGYGQRLEGGKVTSEEGGADRLVSAVLFDFHQTLFAVESTRAWVRNAAVRAGSRLSLDMAARMGAHVEQVRDSPEGQSLLRGRDRSPEAHRIATLAWLDLAGVSNPLRHAMYDRMMDPEAWRPYADTSVVLHALAKEGVRVGIVSNTGWDIRSIVDRHRLAALIEAWALSCEHGVEKPDPALFLVACSELGVQPEQTLMVGDNPLTDGGAVFAGVPVYLLPMAEQPMSRGLAFVHRLVRDGSRPRPR